MKYRFLSTIAAGALALGAVAAAPSAEAAVTTADLSVRAGPGTGYARIGVVPRGGYVAVGGCTSTGSWCQINWPGGEGWVSAAYLMDDGRDRRDRYDRVRDQHRYRAAPGAGVYLGLPRIGFYFGDTDRRDRRDRRDWGWRGRR